MDIFDIFAAVSFEYAVYSNLAATDPGASPQVSHPGTLPGSIEGAEVLEPCPNPQQGH